MPCALMVRAAAGAVACRVGRTGLICYVGDGCAVAGVAGALAGIVEGGHGD